jgi:hypothetical protein
VRDVVAQFAPEELPLLTGLHGLDDAEIGRRLVPEARRDDPLGFGTGEIVVLASPIVWIAVQQVVDRMTASAVDGIRARAGALLRRKLGRTPPTLPLPRFGRTELLEVQARVVEMATQSGMEQARAEQLAASVVGRIELGDSPTTDEE